MDIAKTVLTHLLSPPFLKLWGILAAALLVAAVAKSAWFKGWVGEQFVKFLLWLRLPKEQYTVIHNVTLPTEDGTTQIDHIVVSRFGVFVIETKNMKGWIFGSEKQAKWTQQIYKHKNQFQNPLRQNYKHTATLKDILSLPEDSVHSVVVFVGDSTFKTDMPANVTYAKGCTDYIRQFTEPVLSESQVADVVQAIQDNRLAASLRTHREHVRHVQEIKESKAPKRQPEAASVAPVLAAAAVASDPVCQKCGSPMVRRTAKRGQNAGNEFWGCSQYPKCRSIQPV